VAEHAKAVSAIGIPHDFVPGLAGVTAFTTEIAEPDRDGGALRYRGVDIEDLVSEKVEFVTYGRCWWMASSATLFHRRNRSNCRCTPPMCGSTYKPDWPC